MAHDDRVAISDACRAALAVLRTLHGWADVSPFSYYDAFSPHLNLACQPPAFLTEAERPAFAPLAFWGSLPPPDGRAPRLGGERAVPPRRIYASMGTISWRYYAPAALGALRAVAEAVARRRDLEAVISLGGAAVDARGARASERPRRALGRPARAAGRGRRLRHPQRHELHARGALPPGADGQLPDLRRSAGAVGPHCEFGLAVPLAEPRGPVTADDVDAALERLVAKGAALDDALALAHARELEVVAARPAVVDQILALA